MARPSTSVKNSTGNTVPSAAAFSGFTGTISTMRCASEGMCRAVSAMPAVPALNRSAAATSGEMTSPFKTSGATNIVKTPPATGSRRTPAPPRRQPADAPQVGRAADAADDERDDEGNHRHPDRVDPNRADRLDDGHERLGRMTPRDRQGHAGREADDEGEKGAKGGGQGRSLYSG